jgi:hypothetical protein
MPSATIADCFVAKGPKAHLELVAAGSKLIHQSPLRAPRVKSPTAVAWVTTSSSDYVILTCPECLRTFSIEQPEIADESYSETCVFRGSDVSFYML